MGNAPLFRFCRQLKTLPCRSKNYTILARLNLQSLELLMLLIHKLINLLKFDLKNSTQVVHLNGIFTLTLVDLHP